MLEAVGAFVRENRFVCNVTVFQVNLTKVEGARAGSDRTGPGSLLPVWPGAFYLCGQGPSTCVAKEPVTCVVKESSTCVARSLLSVWPGPRSLLLRENYY